mgnify:CR=1 FL=1
MKKGLVNKVKTLKVCIALKCLVDENKKASGGINCKISSLLRLDLTRLRSVISYSLESVTYFRFLFFNTRVVLVQKTVYLNSISEDNEKQ